MSVCSDLSHGSDGSGSRSRNLIKLLRSSRRYSKAELSEEKNKMELTTNEATSPPIAKSPVDKPQKRMSVSGEGAAASDISRLIASLPPKTPRLTVSSDKAPSTTVPQKPVDNTSALKLGSIKPPAHMPKPPAHMPQKPVDNTSVPKSCQPPASSPSSSSNKTKTFSLKIEKPPAPSKDINYSRNYGFAETDDLRAPSEKTRDEVQRVHSLVASNKTFEWDGNAGLASNARLDKEQKQACSSATRSVFKGFVESEREQALVQEQLQEELRNPLKLSLRPGSMSLYSCLEGAIPSIEEAVIYSC